MVVEKPEQVRLAGTVTAASDPPVARWTIELRRASHERRQGGWFVLEVSGRAVRVEVGDGALVGEPTIVAEGTFRELRAGAGAVFPGDLAPPFDPAKLTVHAIQAGDLVELAGEVLETAIDGDGDYRASPTASPRLVRGHQVVRGPDATTVLDRTLADAAAASPPPPDTRDPGSPAYQATLREWAWGLAAGTAALVAAVLHLTHAAPGAIVPAIVLAATALVARPARLPRFHVRAGGPERTWDAGTVQFTSFAVYWPLVLGLWDLRGAPAVLTLAELAILAGAELAKGADVGRLGRLTRAAAWDGGDGGPVVIEGVVEDPTPVEIGGTPAALGREVKGYIRRRASGVTRQDFHAKGTFLVRTAHGVLELAPDDLYWASSVVATRWTDEEHYVDTEIVPVGGRMAAVGWIARTGDDARLTVGDHAVIALATGPRGDPRGLAAAALRGRWVTIAGLALCGAAAVVALVT